MTSHSTSREQSMHPNSSLTPLGLQLAELLDIPMTLTTRPKSVDIRIAYSKYLAYQEANTKMLHMIDDGTWPIDPPGDALIETFVSKSVWHANYKILFPQVIQYPRLAKWLRSEKDAMTSVELFGKEKRCFTFVDLRRLLEELSLKKGKGKRKVRNSLDESDHENRKKGKKEKKGASSRIV